MRTPWLALGLLLLLGCPETAPPAATCPAGFVECGAACIDPATNALHCGASGECTGASAGAQCGQDAVCVAGGCASTDATLAGLVLSTGTMSPEFAPGMLLYLVTVGARFATITLTPTAAGGEATIEVNGEPVVSGTASPAIALASAASTPVTIRVVAPGGASQTYGLLVERRRVDYLKASNTGGADGFGLALSLSGDTLAISAPFEDSGYHGVNMPQDDDSSPDAGAVYVFVRDALGEWRQQVYLKASNAGASDIFGMSVALSGDTLVVGAPSEDGAGDGLQNAGAAYVFVRDGLGQWSEQAYLTASNPGPQDGFGSSVAADGDTLVVGAVGEASAATGVNGDQADDTITGAGAAYVFVRDGSGAWQQQAYLKASNTGLYDRFGVTLSLSGDTVAVGAMGEDSAATGVDGDGSNDEASRAGAAYVFVRNAIGVWSQQAYVKASNAGAGDEFGNAVSLSGDTLVVGARSEASGVAGDESDDSTEEAGAVYVFRRGGGGAWAQEAYLKAPTPHVDEDFGWSVAVDGGVLAVGVYGDDGPATGLGNLDFVDSGAVHVFVRDPGGAWQWEARTEAPVPVAEAAFGYSVAVAGDTVVAGATGENSGATGVNGDQSRYDAAASGAAYVY